MIIARTVSIALLSACLLALPGCGGDATMGQVEGVVTIDGNPLANASVSFFPPEGGRPATGLTDAEGQYKLKTFKPDDGAMVGMNQVAIIAIEVISQGGGGGATQGEDFGFDPRSRPDKTRWLIPPRYGKAGSSGLEFEVKPGSNQADFALTSK